MKKIRLQKSEDEKKMEDFYKFKADVYQYLDGKIETLNNTYTSKFKTVFDFVDRADEKLRSLLD